jgi:hypothetical protein
MASADTERRAGAARRRAEPDARLRRLGARRGGHRQRHQLLGADGPQPQGADDSGAALPFSRSYIATNSVARIKETMTVSATAADLLVANGDVLTVQRIATASGLALPVGLIELAYRLR